MGSEIISLCFCCTLDLGDIILSGLRHTLKKRAAYVRKQPATWPRPSITEYHLSDGRCYAIEDDCDDRGLCVVWVHRVMSPRYVCSNCGEIHRASSPMMTPDPSRWCSWECASESTE